MKYTNTWIQRPFDDPNGIADVDSHMNRMADNGWRLHSANAISASGVGGPFNVHFFYWERDG